MKNNVYARYIYKLVLSSEKTSIDLSWKHFLHLDCLAVLIVISSIWQKMKILLCQLAV